MRPEVAKIALMTIGQLCETLKKAVDPIVEAIIRVVSNKAGAKSISVFILDGSFASFNTLIQRNSQNFIKCRY